MKIFCEICKWPIQPSKGMRPLGGGRYVHPECQEAQKRKEEIEREEARKRDGR